MLVALSNMYKPADITPVRGIETQGPLYNVKRQSGKGSFKQNKRAAAKRRGKRK